MSDNTTQQLSWQARADQLEAENAELRRDVEHVRCLLSAALPFVEAVFLSGHPVCSRFPRLVAMMRAERALIPPAPRDPEGEA